MLVCSSCARKRVDSKRDGHAIRNVEETLHNPGNPPQQKSVSIQPVSEKRRSSYEMSKFTKDDEQLLIRLSYTLSYNTKTKLANWVGWHLTREHTDGPFSRKGVPYYDQDGYAIGIGPVTNETVRGVYFRDSMIKGQGQEFEDWASAKDYNMNHGHLCPAADNKWSKEAMNQSFLLTNMCPQNIDLNAGDWEALEKKCRTWAKRYGDIYIVAGPIFHKNNYRTIGNNKVGIPDAFFKVILCTNDSPKALGYIFPNEGSSHQLTHYMCSVDSVESVTGIDFFFNLPDEIENIVEKTSELRYW